MISETDKAWAAGFFDGEGSISMWQVNHANGMRFGIRLTVTQKHKRPLLKLQKLWGGTINKQKSEKYEKTNCWYWAVYGWDMLYFLDDILPYSVQKHRQIKLAVAYQLRRQIKPGRRLTNAERQADLKTYTMLCALNHA